MICLVPVKNSVSEILLMIQTHSFLVKIMQSELESDVNHGMYWESSSYKHNFVSRIYIALGERSSQI